MGFVKMNQRGLPVCARCGHVLDPEIEDNCDRYAVIAGEIVCEFCLADHLRDEAQEDPFHVAEALGFPVFDVIRRETA